MIIFLLLIFSSTIFFPQTSEECLDCHDDKELAIKKTSKKISLYVDKILLEKSVHSELECIDCHVDFDSENIPHKEGLNISKFECSKCHKEIVYQYEKSLHGIALTQGKYLAPNCVTCHSKHNILSSKNPKSKTFKMNIPQLCGDCHKDGTKVSELKNIDQKSILENYSESIHGDGLFKRGLIVTAVCNDCHSSHNILPHQDPNSSINRNNIASTCSNCHAQIEAVHVKVIEGKLWETEPNKIPACVDCHQPHSVRRVIYDEKYTDNYCMSCHINKDLHKEKNGKQISLFIEFDKFKNSAHNESSCIKCHTNINVSKNPVCLDSGPVDCSSCHAEQVNDYQISYHGQLFAKKNEDAPYCTDCHEKHETRTKSHPLSKTFRKNIPELCAKCHREGEKAAKRYKGDQKNIVESYEMSIHGKGLVESGLIVTAICTDCHTSHKGLPSSDPLSSINEANIVKTCSQCHYGIYELFEQSVHSKTVTKTKKKLPTCFDCHKSHSIERVERSDFRQGIIDQCGKCHEEVTKTYFDTFHGKVSKLGEIGAAKCYDCHGSHNILPTDNPKSTLSRANVVETCRSCHPNSNHKFVGYLTHATHHDPKKYPFLFYTFWAMTILLVSTFTFFGIHTLLWFPRALKEKKNKKNNH
ncbi:MAG: cytochrome c3 family protein [Melioribacteraceae bacterium]